MGIWYDIEKEAKLENISTSILAEYLLSYNGNLNDLTIKKLCKDSKVSYATPTRLAQKLGYDGFKELKYILINEAKNIASDAFHSRKLSIEDYRKKLNEALDDSLVSITTEDIEYIAKAFLKYERIKIYGIGRSGHIATGLQARLMRFNKVPVCPTNESEIYTTSRLANESDLVVVISYSGHTKTVMEPLEFCQKNGVETILFTANQKMINCASKTICLDIVESEVSNYSTLSTIVLSIILDFVYLKMIELDENLHNYLDITTIRK